MHIYRHLGPRDEETRHGDQTKKRAEAEKTVLIGSIDASTIALISASSPAAMEKVENIEQWINRC